MGTRALVEIVEQGKTLVTIYRQYDGYPGGLGNDIVTALAGGKSRIVNGFSGGDQAPSVFNGMGCLAAYLVGAVKEKTIGNVYIMPPGTRDVGEEFIYTIRADEENKLVISVTDGGGALHYDGLLSDYRTDVEKELQK